MGVDEEELRAAEAHIARLEGELLQLKDTKSELQALREEHRQLRRSAQGRLTKILSAPFRAFRARKPVVAKEASEYERWLARHRTSGEELARLRERSRAFAYQPLVSILMPTFNSNENYLRAAVESVLAQVYSNWELIIVDDGSPQPSRLLRQFSDSRVKVFLEKQHGGISAALNIALRHGRGDWIALLDHDDLLEPDALFRGVEWLHDDRAADVIYTDEDKIIDDHFAAPMLKPDWSADFFLTHDYLGHFVAIRRELIDEFRGDFDGAQDYDLLLRISEKTDRIRHIPRVLYHWRRTKESTAHNIRRKPGALEAGRSAIAQHLQHSGVKGRVTIDWETHAYRIRREVTPAKVAIILSDADAKALAILRERTSYPAFEVMTGQAAFSEIRSELLLFLDRDLEPLRDDWLSILVEYASSREIGVVAPRIVAADGTVESAGLLLFSGGKVGFAFAGVPRGFRGANRQLQTVRNYSAVSPSCMMTRRDLFQKFTAGTAMESLGCARDDRMSAGVEFCLGLRDAGLRVVSIPYAEVRRTSTRPSATESCPQLVQRWPSFFARDPFYNPNLSRERADFSLGDPSHA